MSPVRILCGIVVGKEMPKTRKVKVVRTVRHGLYETIVRLHKYYLVHDEKEQSHVGDKVMMRETRPRSKKKYFEIIEVIKEN
jgi:small subunit ribosomal protein S17